MVESSPALQSVDDCVEYFHAGETPEKDWVIGTEHEKIAVYEETFERELYVIRRRIEKAAGAAGDASEVPDAPSSRVAVVAFATGLGRVSTRLPPAGYASAMAYTVVPSLLAV